MSKAILASVLTAIAIAAIAAGCGGGGDDSSSSAGGGGETATAGPSKAQFIEEGDAICARASKESEVKAEEFAEENDFNLEKANEQQLVEAISDVLVPSLNQQAEELAALEPPAGDEQQVEAIIASLEDAVVKIEANPTRVFDAKVLKKPSQLAVAYGFEECGEE